MKPHLNHKILDSSNSIGKYNIFSRNFLLFYTSWIVLFSFSKYILFKGDPPFSISFIKETLIVVFFYFLLLELMFRRFMIDKFYFLWSIKWFLPLLTIGFLYFVIDVKRGAPIFRSIDSLKDFLFPFVIILVGVISGSRRSFNLVDFMRPFTFFMILILLFSLYQVFFFSLDDFIKYGMWEGEEKLGHILRVTAKGETLFGNRPRGIFGNALAMGFAGIFMFYVGCLGLKVDPKFRTLYILNIIFSVVVIIFTYSRTAYAAFAISILTQLKINWKNVFTYLIIFPVFFYIFWIMTFHSSKLDYSSIGHINSYLITFEYVKDNPFGYGISFSGVREGQIGVDGNYLYVLLNVGIIGLAVYLSSYYYFYKVARFFYEEYAAKAVRGVVIALLASSFFVYIHENSATWLSHLWIGIVIGHFTGDKYYEQSLG
jgi:hypothetical protein